MATEGFSKPKIELTTEQLEGLLEIKTTLHKKLKEALEADQWIKFIVAPNYDLFMDTRDHELIAASAAEHKDDCLVSDGVLRLNAKNEALLFTYTYGGEEKFKNLQQAAENKITKLLISNGYKISQVLH